MNSKVIFTILIFVINFNAIFGQLSCNYTLSANAYTCDLTINNPTGLNNFASIIGTHVSEYTDSDVVNIIRTSGSISTNIPSIICSKFTNIQYMDLQFIGIQRVDDFSFNDCAALDFANLQNNQISTVHERAFIGNLNLRRLHLNRNQLTTLPENVFQNQHNMEVLWLSSNRITDLPEKTFWSLTKMQGLELTSNQLTTIKPEWFENLQSLMFLYLYYNLITDFPKNAFSQMTNLNTVYASGNNLKMLHADSFGVLPRLREIYVDFNEVDAIDENILENTGLNRFDMRGNLCANRDIFDPSISRDVMRAELRICFDNYSNITSGH